MPCAERSSVPCASAHCYAAVLVWKRCWCAVVLACNSSNLGGGESANATVDSLRQHGGGA
eukprot:scaffold2752_cov393-Prasinococcus_capsulatus_cf.AAC.31